MPVFIVFDTRTLRAVANVGDLPFPEPWQAGPGQAIVEAPVGFPEVGGPLDELAFVQAFGGQWQAVWDPALALQAARGYAVEDIRAKASQLLEPWDERLARRREELVLSPGDAAVIESLYAALGARRRIRDASNAAQVAAGGAVSVAGAWDLAGSWHLNMPPALPPDPIITRGAFLARLALSPAELLDPVWQAMTNALGVYRYVDLRLAGAQLAPLVAVGKLTQARADAALDQSAIGWAERDYSVGVA